ncbi:hypothetical protein FHS16_001290 [Paenibacillus endophyticus]|uniref:Uncharacterized protein n=1 Tax=Paenibacillus endophyticus TaxID=1294268 RepID=A0A7W5C4V0_9BACL|nr:hypothetical protein [Paenibacillus endophyticus]MBB3151247.1 hypothetical protein [Paenibacillus endophyticus]
MYVPDTALTKQLDQTAEQKARAAANGSPHGLEFQYRAFYMVHCG